MAQPKGTKRTPNPRTEKVTARITPEEALVLEFVRATTKKTPSTQIHEAMRKCIEFDRLLPLAQEFFESGKQAVASLDK
jgi:hypothetical protein